MIALKSPPALLIGLLVLTACGDVNRTASEFTQSNRKVATSGNDEPERVPAAVPVEDRPAQPSTPPPPRPILGVALASLPGSLVRGEGFLRPQGEMSIVSVALSGGTSHTTYEGAIRRGSCASPGSTIASLVPVSSDTSGRGTAISFAPVPTDSLSKTSHVVTYGKGGRPEACGAISGGAQPEPAPDQVVPA